MKPIELKEIIGSSPVEYLLIINGERAATAEVNLSGTHLKDGPHISATFHDYQNFKEFGGCRLSDIPENLHLISVEGSPEVSLRDGQILVQGLRITPPNSPYGWSDSRAKFSEDLTLSFYLELKLNNWKGPYTAEEFVNEIEKGFAERGESETSEIISSGDGWYRIKFRLASPDSYIVEETDRLVSLINQVLVVADYNLFYRNASDALISRFNFREEVRVPCEQYLLYFTRFLEDLGVEATADIRHEAGQVLFSVTPADKDEALDKIHEALMVYLGLSASPVNNLATLDYEIAVQRLVSEVQTLQSRVTLARAELQLKEATIQQQQVTIEQLRPGGGLLLDSLKEVTPKPKDSEEVLGGLAEITKYEGKGFNLNLPEAFRRLRQLFGEKGGKK